MDIYSQVDRYISEQFGLEDPILVQVEQSIRDNGLPEHSVSPVQGQFLALLVQLCKAKRIIEVGTLGGYSTIWMARALPEDGTLTSIEIDPNAAEVARKNIREANLDHKVTVLTGDARGILDGISSSKAIPNPSGTSSPKANPNPDGISSPKAAASNPIDLFFMDADKPNYIQYFNWALENSRPGSLILADNVIRDGKLLDENSQDEKVIGVRAYCKMLAQESRVTTSILQQVGEKAYDGLAISMVK